ncbi:MULTISPECIES: flagellar hook-basal body protein [Bacillaceae]|uniref:Flagellar hook-basal body protein n=1 Tax=Evansella alkalicola TaxID=745819 RepID=A0ABS6JXW0_9BACI|nr:MULTISPECIES: flagellar hook-basal body protein [Bacillaceae]MBU9723418.1 flagellar hook-basal body protein [Bacillus alkalicola]
MIRGLYTAGAGMITQQRRQEMLTDNMANANTPGYKADQASMRAFPNQLIRAMGTDHLQRHGTTHVGELSTGVYMQERTPNFRQGDIYETFNTTDLALLQGVVPAGDNGQEGMLFYTVENGDGEVRYTRNGNFTVDGAGFLTTAQGNYVLDAAGERLNVGSENFTVTADGQVVNALTEQPVGQINVALVMDPDQLVKVGNGFLRYDGDGEIQTAIGNGGVTFQLQQGFLERSNVDAAQTVTQMMTALRNFEANQRVLQAYDRSLERTVNDIGRIG